MYVVGFDQRYLHCLRRIRNTLGYYSNHLHDGLGPYGCIYTLCLKKIAP